MSNSTQRLAPSIHTEKSGQRVSLVFTWGEGIQAATLRLGQSLIVGRTPPSQLILADRSLSRAHARITLREDATTFLEDLESTNGCTVNGQRVDQAVIQHGDAVQLGSVELAIYPLSTGTPARQRLSHAAFMQQLRDELSLARATGRKITVLALQHRVLQLDAQTYLVRASSDRICALTPSLSLVLWLDHDESGALRSLDQLRELDTSIGFGLASYPSLSCSADELVDRALEAARDSKKGALTVATADQSSAHHGSVIVRAPAMIRLYELVARAGRASLPVLVLGETGVGKELVARTLHNQGTRSRQPFRALNCAAIPPTLMEGTLFGHERGAFTGAGRQTAGIFEQAHGGTVFLDEVAELSLPAQAALLRVLEERRVTRVGGSREIEVDVRIVAATHRNLEEMVAAGTFREDLMYRLDALTLLVPPLRDRKEEILPLASKFLERARETCACTAVSLSQEAQNALLAYGWPGNVRQLKNVMERAAVLCSGEQIQLEELPAHVVQATMAETAQVDHDAAAAQSDDSYLSEALSLPERVRAFETECIRAALLRAGGNQTEAARILGVPRKTLTTKVQALGLLAR